MKLRDENKTTTNSKVERLTHRHLVAESTGKCSYCKPHKGENFNKHSRHDKKSWKDMN